MAKSKFKEVNCSYCKKVTKMIILKEEPDENKGWFRCTKCKHSFCIDVTILEDEKKEEKPVIKLDKENSTVYSPFKEYSIGQSIFHTEWDDYGKIEYKKKLSNGQSAIMVKFDKSGPKNLIEGLKTDDDIKTEEKEDIIENDYNGGLEEEKVAIDLESEGSSESDPG
jgi:hypothetical protein